MLARDNHVTEQLLTLINKESFSVDDAMALVRQNADPDIKNKNGHCLLNILLKMEEDTAIIELIDVHHANLALACDLPPTFQINPDQLKRQDEIGRGSFGKVFLGEYTNQEVAIKEIASFQQNNFTKYLHQYLREIQLMYTLSRANPHHNIITIVGMNIQKTCYAIIMEYASLGTLEDLIKNNSNLISTWETREKIIAGMTDGLDHIHKHKIIHADFKSANVLITRDLLPKIIDFGLSAYEDEIISQGTPATKAPEVLAKGNNTYKSDVFSLGATIWEALVIKLILRILPGSIKTPEELAAFLFSGKRPAIPAKVSSLKMEMMINWCWHTDPDKRPTANELTIMLGSPVDEIYEKLKSIIPTPLAIACKYGRIDIVIELLKDYSNIDEIYQEGCTPFYLACENGHLDIVELLMQHKANIRKSDSNNLTPFSIACKNGHKSIVELLINKVNIHTTDDDGCTALWHACMEGHLDIVELLIKAKADVAQENIYEETPFWTACQRGHLGIINLLLNMKVNSNQENNNGKTPLSVACFNGHLSIVEALLIHKVDIHKANKKGGTPLYMATQMGHTDIVQLLLEHGAQEDINLNGYKKHTPLLVACLSQHTHNKPELFRLLIGNGASLISKNDKGETALDIAFGQKNQAAIMELLLAVKYANPFVEPIACPGTRTEIRHWVLSNKHQEIFDDSFFNNLQLNLHIGVFMRILKKHKLYNRLVVFTGSDKIDQKQAALYSKLLLENSYSANEIIILIYDLLAHSSGLKLKSNVATAMGFKQTNNALMYFQSHIFENLKLENPHLENDEQCLAYLSETKIPALKQASQTRLVI